MRDAILVQTIYCATPNPKPDAHFRSQVCKGLEDRSPQSTLEYNLMTAILIWPLTQPVMCEMGLSSFVAMS